MPATVENNTKKRCVCVTHIVCVCVCTYNAVGKVSMEIEKVTSELYAPSSPKGMAMTRVNTLVACYIIPTIALTIIACTNGMLM